MRKTKELVVNKNKTVKLISDQKWELRFLSNFRLGFPSEFSLNEIRENERNKFVHFVQNFRKFRCIFDEFFDLYFCEKNKILKRK